jgi:hypothetical protein
MMIIITRTPNQSIDGSGVIVVVGGIMTGGI